ncbi:MAG TPA: DegQ family serine endoprotease [Thermodesulfobacteriota bacterium]
MSPAPRARIRIAAAILAATLSAPLDAWAAEGAQPPAEQSGAKTPAQPAGRGSVPQGGAVQTVPSFVSLARAIENSVVNVQVRSKTPETRPGRQTPPFPFGPGPNPFGVPRTPRSPIPRQGLGSGFIVSEDGYILTNNHVVEDAEEVKVRLRDEREFTARIIGRDPKTDLALIKIDVPDTKLPAVTFGDSDRLEVGEWVLAVGNPFGLDHSVTAGIISAKGRVIGAGPYDEFLQTDASINPGNSGGPLVNMRGEVVGISTAIVAQGQGVGFAIPINIAKSLLPQLRDKGSVSRGWLGIVIQRLTPELARGFNVPEDRGALVADVMKGSPAEKGGLKRGDVVVSFNGDEIKEVTDLTRRVAAAPIGSEAKVTVIRDGQRVELPITLGEMPNETQQASVEEEPSSRPLGMALQELTPELARQLEIDEESGVVVTDVDQDSPAARAGIQEGDVIQEVNRRRVATVADVEAALSAAQGAQPVLVLVKRDDGAFYLPIERQ